MKYRVSLISYGVLNLAVLLASGCGSSNAAASSQSAGAGISPKKFADAVHAVMMADRTVYASQVVTRLKKQDSPVKPDEYWQDETTGHAIPLPAQMFRMGAELVAEDPGAGFTYSLKSLWPLNSQHKPASDFEIEALTFLSKNPGENFYQEETLGGKKYFTAFYPDRAVAEACWSCHNDHPNKAEDYPEFKEGDVMGAVAVRVPLE
ncbi:MAG: DUF3365 domain-containing protein [Planctomycetales bacterium]|nr:DUF3365 domain-containing protein [Planctomycetales bacterium]